MIQPSAKITRIDSNAEFTGTCINDLMNTVNKIAANNVTPIRSDDKEYAAYCESCGVPTDQVGK